MWSIFAVIRHSFVVLLLLKVIYLMVSLLIGLITNTKVFWQQTIEVMIFFTYGLFLNKVGIETTFDSFRWNPKTFLESGFSHDFYMNSFFIWSTLFFGEFGDFGRLTIFNSIPCSGSIVDNGALCYLFLEREEGREKVPCLKYVLCWKNISFVHSVFHLSITRTLYLSITLTCQHTLAHYSLFPWLMRRKRDEYSKAKPLPNELLHLCKIALRLIYSC